jgi:hypothetical protein
MIRLYYKIDNWDLLEKYSDANLIYIKLDKIERTFCKCGEVYTSRVTKCKSCGNYNMLDLGERRRYRMSGDKEYTNLSRKEKTLEPDVWRVEEKTIYVHSIDEKVIQFCEATGGVIELGNNYAKGGFRIASDELLAEIKTEYRYYKKYKDSFESLPKDLQVIHNLTALINAKNEYPEFATDTNIKLYPKFFFYIIKNHQKILAETQDINIILDKFGIPEEFRPYIERFFDDYSYYYFYSVNNKFPNYTKLKKEYKKIIFTAFEQMILRATNIETISRQISDLQDVTEPKDISFGYRCSATVSRDDIKYLAGFLKENLLMYGEETVREYLKRVDFLKKNKYEINENNLKTKNFKFFFNYKNLSEKHRFPKEKIDAFADLIDIAPLKAVNLLRTRRKLTKAQLEEIYKIVK